jgi:hypothetical protein
MASRVMRNEPRLTAALVLSAAAVACSAPVLGEDDVIAEIRLAYEGAHAVVVPDGSSLPSLALPKPEKPGAPVTLPTPDSGLTPLEAIPDHCHEPAEHAFEGDGRTDGEVHLPFADDGGNAHIYTVLYDVGDDASCVFVKDWSSFLDDWVIRSCSHFVTVEGNITAPPFTAGSFHVCSTGDGESMTPVLCSDSPVLERCKAAASTPVEPGVATVTGPNAVANPRADETDERVASREP